MEYKENEKTRNEVGKTNFAGMGNIGRKRNLWKMGNSGKIKNISEIGEDKKILGIIRKLL